jgi:predicted AAA+ superfamily ATPase
MKKRILAAYLKRDAGLYPVVTLTGPRQSGKTTLARNTFPSHTYVTLEDLELRTFASEDPRGFLARYREGAILDEVQRVPSLFSYIQGDVDADPRPGRFVLTGSHNFLLMKEISQSLAGRSAILHLLPFNRSELEDQDSPAPGNPQQLFSNHVSSLSLWNTLFTGMYPRIHDRNIPPEIWLADYIQTYLERDVRQLVNVGDLESFGRFLKLCAGRAGQLLNFSSLAVDAGVSVDTARRWISVLQTSFLIFLLPPHHRNFNKRVVKNPKLYFYDTGLICRLLGMSSPSELEQGTFRGPVFENYVVAECAKTFHHHRMTPPLFFWRDRLGHEMDLIMEKGNELFAVEIKSGQTMNSDMLAGFRWWQETSGQSASTCTLVYGGSARDERNGIPIRPWFSI